MTVRVFERPRSKVEVLKEGYCLGSSLAETRPALIRIKVILRCTMVLGRYTNPKDDLLPVKLRRRSGNQHYHSPRLTMGQFVLALTPKTQPDVWVGYKTDGPSFNKTLH